MRLLLDTHTLLWFLSDDPQLSPTAREHMEDPGNELFLSLASVWEIAIKVSIGKLALESPLEPFLPDQLHENDIQLLPISMAHTLRVASLPFHHRDPFDRLLVAQSLAEDLPVIGI